MPYDSSLDEQIFSQAWEGQTSKIVVGVYSYNNGPKKLQITREVHNREGAPGFAKLGRLAKEEALGILPIIQEALKVM